MTLFVRATPNAGRDRIDGIERRDDGAVYLKLRVAAPPEDGKANKAVIALLAKTLRCPKSAVSLISGDTARIKTLAIAGDPASLCAILERLAAG